MKRKIVIILFLFIIAASSKALLSSPKAPKEFDKGIETFLRNPIKQFQSDNVEGVFRIVVLSNISEYCVNSYLQGTITQKQAHFYLDKIVKTSLSPSISPYKKQNILTTPLQKRGMYLSHLNVILGAYKRGTGDDKYQQINKRISEYLATTSKKDSFAHITSFHNRPYRWPADQTTTLYSLYLYDKNYKTSLSKEPIQKWLAYMENAVDSTTGLHISEVTGGRNYSNYPRGCALSWSVRYMAAFAPIEAKSLWNNYKRYFKFDGGMVAGFREWPKGIDLGEDCDSGPIIWGLGAAATGFALGASRAVGDDITYNQLLSSLTVGKKMGGAETEKVGNSILSRSIELYGKSYFSWY